MAMTLEQAMRHAAQVVELYDDALAGSDEMATSTDCAEVLNALADYHAYISQPAQAVDVTDAEIAEWAERHDLSFGGSKTDARDAFEDAESHHLTRALGTAQGWRDIASAPKDGRQLILLLIPSRFPQVSSFPQVAFSNTWWTAGFSVENKPTHWMPLEPLPTPPTDGVGR